MTVIFGARFAAFEGESCGLIECDCAGVFLCRSQPHPVRQTRLGKIEKLAANAEALKTGVQEKLVELTVSRFQGKHANNLVAEVCDMQVPPRLQLLTKSGPKRIKTKVIAVTKSG